jgi:hypothetical protein
MYEEGSVFIQRRIAARKRMTPSFTTQIGTISSH